MKRILVFLIALTLCLCGCSKKPVNTEQSSKLRVLTTIFPPYDFVRQIAEDKVELEMLLPPDSESHGFEPTLLDLSKIQKSDLVLYAGDESDSWVQKLDKDEYDTTILALNDMVDINESHKEHLWTSVRNSIKMVSQISATLCSIDPDNAEFYKTNTNNLLKELKVLDNDFALAVANAPQKTLIFAERFPFTCFAEDYGLEWQSAFDHCSSDFEPKIDVIQNLIKTVKSKKISTVFYIEFSNQSIADTICAATNCKKALFHSCHNITKQEWDSGATYVSLMRNNLEQLRKALQYAS